MLTFIVFCSCEQLKSKKYYYCLSSRLGWKFSVYCSTKRKDSTAYFYCPQLQTFGILSSWSDESATRRSFVLFNCLHSEFMSIDNKCKFFIFYSSKNLAEKAVLWDLRGIENVKKHDFVAELVRGSKEFQLRFLTKSIRGRTKLLWFEEWTKKIVQLKRGEEWFTVAST